MGALVLQDAGLLVEYPDTSMSIPLGHPIFTEALNQSHYWLITLLESARFPGVKILGKGPINGREQCSLGSLVGKYA